MSLTPSRRSAARWAALPAAALLAAGLVACSAANEQQSGGAGAAGGGQNLSGNIRGAGASTQKVAQDAWIATFTGQNPGVTMSYDPIGSGGGRSNFINGAIAYAGSDAALKPEEIQGAAGRCGGQVVEFPVYISPIAITYNLPGVQNLKLDATTIGNIFQGKITTWNDPAIAALNPGVQLPAARIVTVHRSDDSGTTENFTDYLNGAAPQAWPQKKGGTWPAGLQGEAAQGTSGVVNIVRQTPNSITYADESQVRGMQTAQVKVGNEFVAPSPEAAAKILADSPRAQVPNQPNVFAFNLNRKTAASGTYPVVLSSYELACGHYADANQAKIVKAYLGYIVSQQGQQLAAQQAGSAPLSDDLRNQIEPAINSITG